MKADMYEGKILNKQQTTQWGGVFLYDWIRLFATLCVVVGHSAYLNITTALGGVSYEVPQYASHFYYCAAFKILRVLAGWVYGFHMPLFFMLSGAVFHLKPMNDFDSFCKKKIRRLIVPFFVYGFLFMLPVKFLGNFYAKNTILPALRSFSGGGESGHLWFLPALFWCMVAFVMLKKLLERFAIKSKFALLLVCGTVQLLYEHLPFDFFHCKQGLSYIFYFALGFYFETARGRLEAIPKEKLSATLFLCFALVLIDFKYALFGKFPTILFRSFFVVLASLACNAFFSGAFSSNLAAIVRRNLFSVYVFHDPLEYIVLRLFFSSRFLLLKSALGIIAYYAARIFGVVFVSVVLGEIIRNMTKNFAKIFRPVTDKKKHFTNPNGLC